MLLRDGQVLFKGAKEGASATLSADATANYAHRTFYVEWGEGVQAGEVTFESSRQEFTGKWAREGVIICAQGHSAQRITLTGAYLAIRMRISKPVIGGTVEVYGCAH